MRLIKTITAILKRPFPEQGSSFGALRIITGVSLFVTLFLFIFRPFGISTLKDDVFLICLGFGGVTFVASAIYEFVCALLLKLKGETQNWTFGKWILYNLGVILTISLANFIFARLVLFGFIQWDLLPNMIYGTFMIGLLPILAIGALSLGIAEKKYKRIALDINNKNIFTSSTLPSKSHSIFNIPTSHIKYVEAMQNYVIIGYTDPDGQFNRHTERATLKHCLEEAAGSPIIQVHRSFLVNENAITGVSGNAQGLLLALSEIEKVIPVSRSFVQIFRSKKHHSTFVNRP